jgi:hypothetical protein
MSDDPKPVESPTIEQPQVTEVKPPEIDKEALVSELTKMGVTKAEELLNMRRASSETGKLANMLGEVRNENAELKRMIQQLQTGSQAGYQEHQPIDLKQAMRPVVKEVFQEAMVETTQRQMEAMRAQRAEMARIQSNKWFPAVRDVWEKYLNHPTTQDRLLGGETSLTDEYRNVVDAYTSRMLETQTAALQAAQGGIKPPHVEQGNTQSVQNPPASTESVRKLRQISEAQRKGELESNRALDAMVKELFPAELFGLK